MIPNLFNQNALQQVLLNDYYYTEDGVLRSCKTDKAVSCARVKIDGKLTLIKPHRAVFAMHHGWLPPIIDHINRNRFDNRISNLRPASGSMNNCNKALSPTNTSGYAGVQSKMVDGTVLYTSSIITDRVFTNLGTYATAVEAFDAYYAALVEKAGDYAPARESLIADWVKAG
jgi:hypothetical protein